MADLPQVAPATALIAVTREMDTGEPVGLFFFARPGRPAISIDLEPGEGALVAAALSPMEVTPS